MLKKVLVVIACLAGFCGSVNASVITPEWIGADHTVHAEWSNWNPIIMEGETYYAPDIWNASDEASLSLTDTPDAFVYEGAFAGSHDGRDNVLVLEGLGYESMDFFMPNYTGGEFKEIFVQITYQDLGCAPILGVDAYINGQSLTTGISPAYFQGREQLEGNWVTEAFLFIVTPNSDYEFMTLGFETSGVSQVGVDSVVIDTICVPEPASMGLFALGTLFFLKRRQ